MRYLLLAVAITTLYACNKPVKGRNGVAYKNAVQYNDYIVGRQTKLMKNVLAFGKVADYNLDSAEVMLTDFVDETDKMITDIKGMPPYKGDSTLRDAAINSFTFYKRVFGKDYVDLLHIRKRGELGESDVTEMQGIVDKISKEEEGYDDAFHRAQRDFAKKHNMKLRENEMQQEFDKIDGKDN
jgi:hypothetical protein